MIHHFSVWDCLKLVSGFGNTKYKFIQVIGSPFFILTYDFKDIYRMCYFRRRLHDIRLKNQTIKDVKMITCLILK